MTKYIILSIFILNIFGFSFAQSKVASDPGWPRQLTNQGSVLTVYQPQVDDWPNYTKISFRMAFTLVPLHGEKVVGVMTIDALSTVDMTNRMVEIYFLVISKVHFPSLDDSASDRLGMIVKSFIPDGKTIQISLDRVVACTKKQAPASTVAVNNQPPVIFVSYAPAILLQLEGKPQPYKTKDENLQFIFNANWPLFLDKKSGKYFLFDDQEWQTSANAGGPWTFTSSLPASLLKLSSDSQWTNLKSALPAPAQKAASMPKIFYCESPGEIILFSGDPAYKAVQGTSLKYAVNTQSDLFFSKGTNLYYYLTAGRWFSSQSLNGPWTYASANLPADFAQIPPSSDAGRILAAVPGTQEAEDAVMIAQIPTQVQVNATEAAEQVNVTYSGEPKFENIEGTSMQYAVNSPEKVIIVSPNVYYLCSQGIWFWSASPTGPWQAATAVPPVIYTIPPSSPYYNVTFVTQTVSPSGIVVASYTSGYMGSYVVVAGGGVIITSGTGYYSPPFFYYPPYGYPVCYIHPMAYGAYAYHPYYGTSVAYRASYNPYTGTYARSATAYGPYGKATAGQAYNPSTGTYARGASVSTPYGTRSAAQAYNPYTGASASTRQQSNAYGQAGTTTVSNGKGQSATAGHATNSQGTIAGAANSSGGKAFGASGTNGSSGGMVKTSGGDMYAAKDGNVYSNTNGSWQKADNGNAASSKSTSTLPSSTSSANRPAGTTNSAGAQESRPSGTGTAAASQGKQAAPSSEMNKEAQDRQRGATQSQRYSGSGGGGGGGGGRSGGGGGGRRR
jgi:hypothetical protein